MPLSTNIPFIKFFLDLNMTLGTEYGFQSFQYSTTSYPLIKDNIINSRCLDIDCEIFIHNIGAFTRQTQGKKLIWKITTLIIVWGIDINK